MAEANTGPLEKELMKSFEEECLDLTLKKYRLDIRLDEKDSMFGDLAEFGKRSRSVVTMDQLDADLEKSLPNSKRLCVEKRSNEDTKSDSDVKCVHSDKGCKTMVRWDRIDDHLEECQFRPRKPRMVYDSKTVENTLGKPKIRKVIYSPDIVGNGIGYECGLKFALKQVTKDGVKRDVKFVEDDEDNVFIALFDESDVDFEIQIDNHSKRTICYDFKLGEHEKVHKFFAEKGLNYYLKAVEENGKHFHFVSQSSEEGKALVAMSADRNGISYSEASVNCSRISFNVLFDQTNEVSEYKEECDSYERECALEERKRVFLKRMCENGHRGRCGCPTMQVFVRGLNGKTLVYEVRPNDSIEYLQNLIYEREGIPPKKTQIRFAGKRLEVGRTLKDYDIEKESNLHIVLRLSGGSSGNVGERGVVCFGQKTDQRFSTYDKPFVASKKYLAENFTIELRLKDKSTV